MFRIRAETELKPFLWTLLGTGHCSHLGLITRLGTNNILLRLGLSVLVKGTVFWFMYVFVNRSV